MKNKCPRCRCKRKPVGGLKLMTCLWDSVNGEVLNAYLDNHGFCATCAKEYKKVIDKWWLRQ